MLHKSLKRAVQKAYGGEVSKPGFRKLENIPAFNALRRKISELGIDGGAIRVAQGKCSVPGFAFPHVYLWVLVRREGKVITSRRLRIAEDLTLLEDVTIVDDGSQPAGRPAAFRGYDPRWDVGYE